MAIKNVELRVPFTAWDTSASGGKTGDLANFTLYANTDGTVTSVTGTVSESTASGSPGDYSVLLTAAQMNGKLISLIGKSSTANISIIPTRITTDGGYLVTTKTQVDKMNFTGDDIKATLDGETVEFASGTGSRGYYYINKATKKITLYENDGTTVIVTATLSDSDGIMSMLP